MSKNAGITLIELIIVMALISIIFLICIPRINYDLGYLDSLAEEMLMDVRYVQKENMKKSNSWYIVRINANNKGYEVRGSVDIVNPKIIKSVKFKEGYTVGYNNFIKPYPFSIVFSKSGAPLNAGTITIKDTKSLQYKEITIVPATGRSMIKE